uniref:Uncharacterized protein n=1 Tax=Pseudictyota dubia TaxID=2749911 RepID=A0A7R9W4L7_9STRA
MAREKGGIASEGGEMEALVDRMGATTASPLDRLAGYSGKNYRRGQACFLLLLFACVSVLILRYEEIGEWFSAHEEDVETKPDDPDRESKWGFPDFSLPSAVSTVTDWFKGGDKGEGVGRLSDEARRSLPDLLKALSTARIRIDEMIEADYGEYSFVFSRNETMKGTGIWWPSEKSLSRLKRRMKRKIIEAQLRGGGENDEETVKFTWVTGGHSASAAHGDLMEQSYDVTLLKAAEVAFDALDVTLKSKHYGMGSMGSFELGLCQDEVYGLDIDILNWDFGMTDGRNYWWYQLWVDQAGLHPTFPILFTNNDARKNMNDDCEKRGQGAFNVQWKELPRNLFPDSDTHPNPSSLPRGVANYMCGGQAEQTNKCKDEKFDTKWCDCRGKVSWHPGWKDHLFMGRFMALFLVENLIDAVKEMRERDLSLLSPSENDTSSLAGVPSLSGEYLNHLLAEEEADRQLFQESTVSDNIGSGDLMGEGNWKKILRGNPICHSLRLPNQARFDGIIDGVVATEAAPGSYYSGVDQHYKWNTLPKPGPPSANDSLKSAISSLRPPWMMATDQEMRKPMKYYGYENGCNLTVSHDFRDGFVVRHQDDWMGDIYPLDSEVEAFSRGKYEREGFIIMCDGQCFFSNCNPGGQRWEMKHVGLPEKNGNVSILVDDKPVTGAVALMSDCYFLVGEGGNPNWGPGTANGRKGQYEIKFKVERPGMIHVSSLIVA